MHIQYLLEAVAREGLVEDVALRVPTVVRTEYLYLLRRLNALGYAFKSDIQRHCYNVTVHQTRYARFVLVVSGKETAVYLQHVPRYLADEVSDE